MSSTASKSNNVNVSANALTAKTNGKFASSRIVRPKKGNLYDIIKKTDKFLGENPHLIVYIAVTSIGILFIWYYGLSEKLAVSNAKIEFLQKKFDESEAVYKESVQNEIRIARCKNGAVLECYNKCNIQEVLKRQNVCEATK